MESDQIPSHVPQELVFDYRFADQPGVDRCPYEANSHVHDLPDIFFSPGGYRAKPAWVVTSHKIASEAYTKPELFSSNNVTGFLRLLGKDVDLIPVEIDPPMHRLYRKILNPAFTPKALNPMEDDLRRRARSMIQGLIQRDTFEFETEFGRPYPVRIFLDLMNLPTERLEEFVEWEDQLLHGENDAVVASGAKSIMAYLEEVIPERKASLGDDLLSMIIQSDVDGRPITDEEIFAMSFLIFFGGLDTVAATMTYIFKHLAENLEEQAKLRANPGLIPDAVEEFLRAFSVVSSPRIVALDMTFHGVEMKKGDRVTLASPLADRDPEAFEDPNRVDFERGKARHLAFGSGPHMCAGAPLARRELRIALEEWMAIAPPFVIAEGDRAITRAQGVFDVQRLPLAWADQPQ